MAKGTKVPVIHGFIPVAQLKPGTWRNGCAGRPGEVASFEG